MSTSRDHVTRRNVLTGALASLGLQLIPGRASAARKRRDFIHHALPKDPCIVVYPGNAYLSWGHPNMEKVVEKHRAQVINYNIDRHWISERSDLARDLRQHLEEASQVILVGYSMGACTAVDVVAEADLTEELVKKLSLVLVAPAAKVRRPWSVFAPASRVWEDRWAHGARYLQKARNERKGAWRRFFDRRIRLLYNHDDALVSSQGFREFASFLPSYHVSDCSGIRHLAWLNADEMHDAVLQLLSPRGDEP